MSQDLLKFQWKPCPEGQRVLDGLVAGFLERSPRTAALADAMREKSGTRFFDWIDRLEFPVTEEWEEKLDAAGFTGRDGVWEHEGAIFPRVRHLPESRLFLKVESVADFLACHALQPEIEGVPFGRLRQARAWDELWGAERRGFRGFDAPELEPERVIRSLEVLDSFRMRRRDFGGDADAAFSSLHGLLEEAIVALGKDWACELFFAAERDYWMRRNRAGRVQKARQDALGLGWANHDHHTYRCGRNTFHRVIGVFETLGFTCRERFYAGAEAGWGAQIVEHEATGITIFADVDMSAEEVAGDFAHEGFPERRGLGTVGLWCALHGESLFEAGMHHLEAQFDFDSLRNQLLEESGIGMMSPFTDFPHLRQQFSEGERWAVPENRIRALVEAGEITEKQAEKFRRNGAVGSHLENLERNDGFKGFNQTGISDIIARTDARRLAEEMS